MSPPPRRPTLARIDVIGVGGMHIHLAYARLPRHATGAWDAACRDASVRAALCAGTLAAMPLEDEGHGRGLLTIWPDGETAADWRGSRACARLRAALDEFAEFGEAVEERRFSTPPDGALDDARGAAS